MNETYFGKPITWFREQYQSNRTMQDIADECKCSREYIRQLLSKTNTASKSVSFYLKGCKRKNYNEKEIVKDLSNNMTNVELKAKYNISSFIINRIVKEYNIKRFNKYDVILSKDVLIDYYTKKNYGIVGIAKEFNCSHTTVIKKLKEYGIVMHSRGKPSVKE